MLTEHPTEDTDGYIQLFAALKAYFHKHRIPYSTVIIVSDQHRAIPAALSRELPSTLHIRDLVHWKRNFSADLRKNITLSRYNQQQLDNTIRAHINTALRSDASASRTMNTLAIKPSDSITTALWESHLPGLTLAITPLLKPAYHATLRTYFQLPVDYVIPDTLTATSIQSNPIEGNNTRFKTRLSGSFKTETDELTLKRGHLIFQDDLSKIKDAVTKANKRFQRIDPSTFPQAPEHIEFLKHTILHYPNSCVVVTNKKQCSNCPSIPCRHTSDRDSSHITSHPLVVNKKRNCYKITAPEPFDLLKISQMPNGHTVYLIIVGLVPSMEHLEAQSSPSLVAVTQLDDSPVSSTNWVCSNRECSTLKGVCRHIQYIYYDNKYSRHIEISDDDEPDDTPNPAQLSCQHCGETGHERFQCREWLHKKSTRQPLLTQPTVIPPASSTSSVLADFSMASDTTPNESFINPSDSAALAITDMDSPAILHISDEDSPPPKDSSASYHSPPPFADSEDDEFPYSDAGSDYDTANSDHASIGSDDDILYSSPSGSISPISPYEVLPIAQKPSSTNLLFQFPNLPSTWVWGPLSKCLQMSQHLMSQNV